MDNDKIDKIIDKYQGDASSLIQVLLDIQNETTWLSKEILERVSEKYPVPFSKVLHIATFYKAFDLIPKGSHEIHVCNGTSCHVRGSSRVFSKIKELTKIRPGETDPDLKFSLKAVTCMGCCSAGPSMIVDGKLHSNMDPINTEDVLRSCD